MKAVWYDTFGSAAAALKTGEFQTPSPLKGEVLVRLHASGVNPSDTKKRAGAFPDLLKNGAVIPHSDGAGVIEAVGEGVPADRIGERVFVYQAQYGRRFGTAAEYVAVDSSRAPLLPPDTPFEVGACIGIPMLTAHRCVMADGPVLGKTLVITGGAGRVGYYAIQWAAQAGARVVATASNEGDTEACLAAGAEHVVNHRDVNWGSDVLDYLGGDKADRVIDVEFGANLEQVLKFMAIGGFIVTYSSTVVPEPKLPFLQMMFMDLTIRMVIVYAMPEHAKKLAIRDTSEKLRENQLSHRIARCFALEEASLAHELVELGAPRGSVVLKI